MMKVIYSHLREQRWVWLLLFWTTLIFIFSIPHSMALRKMLFLALFIMTFGYVGKAWREHAQAIRPLLARMVLLQLWIFFVIGVIAQEPLRSLREWVSEWLPPLVCFFIGTGVAFGLREKLPEVELRVFIALLVVLPVSLFVLVNSLVVAHEMMQRPVLSFENMGLTDHKADVGYLITLMEPLLIADMLLRLTQKRLLPVSSLVLGLLLILVLFALIAAGARNGVIVMMLAVLLGGGLALRETVKRQSQAKILFYSATTILLLTGLAFATYQTDPRWQTFSETARLAWDIDRDLSWLGVEEYPLPLTHSGVPVDPSAYFRIAWAHEAWRVLLDHPWGSELGRDAFYRLEVAKYGQAGMAHSHNAWLDTGISIGFPGILLWAGILFLFARTGLRAWRERGDPIGLALVILVIMFAFRGMLDSIFRDHILEQFMLVAGLLWGYLVAVGKKDGAPLRSG